jgi:organic hydroperoxide reductase OsmC/OhrA
MSTYTATVRWKRSADDVFAAGRYSRAHEWTFDGGAVVPASASPHVVPKPYSDEAGVDPEEAFIASLSSCHMLFVLDFASIVTNSADILCEVLDITLQSPDILLEQDNLLDPGENVADRPH